MAYSYSLLAGEGLDLDGLAFGAALGSGLGLGPKTHAPRECALA
jgi:hypothetical protein